MSTLLEKLSKVYGYEFGDLVDRPFDISYLVSKREIWDFVTVDFSFEPVWKSVKERNADYDTVSDMLFSSIIPPDYFGDTSRVDTGALNWMY